MYCLNMLKYVTSLQRHYVPEDIFLWGIMNTNTEGDRLLVKDTRGGMNVIGWNEIAIILERSTMRRISDPSRVCTAIHTIGQRPFCMVFGPKFSSYNLEHTAMRQNEGQNSGVRIHFTQPSHPNIPTGVITPQPIHSSGEHSESTHTPTSAILVEDLNGTSNKDSLGKPPNVSIPLPTSSPITTIVTGKPGQLLSTERQSVTTDTWKKASEDQLSKVCELQETNSGLRGQVAAKDVEKSDVHALAWTEVQHELEELTRLVTELEDFKRLMTAKEKVAKETHLQKLALVQIELEEYKRSSKASIKRLEEEASRYGKHWLQKSPLCRLLKMLTRRRSPPSRQHVENTRCRWMEK
ncbi:hypothetical protein R1flu_021785 [Riccia fluitans]|uniref:Uncharacterized protein n=1 Tax=Riccia fluitans TaxID=41844 RepID=A0ABD1ZQD3_9MARC